MNEELNKLGEILNNEVDILSAKRLPAQSERAFNNLFLQCREFFHESLELEDLIIRRSDIVLQHFAKAYLSEKITYDLHQEYHDLMFSITSKYRNTFTKLKQTTNLIPQVFNYLLDHESKRGVNTGSFGKFLSSYTSEDSKVLTWLELSKEIDSKFNEYRDKYIEHSKENSGLDSVQARDFQSGSVSLFHGGEKYHKMPRRTLDEVIEDSVRSKVDFVQYTLTSTEYGDLLYLHVDSTGVSIGTLKKGEILGVSKVLNEEHRRVYGNHVHMWTNNFTGKYEDLAKEIPLAAASPNSKEMVIFFTDYLIETIKVFQHLTPEDLV